MNVLVWIGWVIAHVALETVVAAAVALWTAKRCFREIDRYVEDTTGELKDAAERLGLVAGEANGDERRPKRG